jgi:hypothetical protein
MAHPSNALPTNMVILSGSNAFTDNITYALHNPTAAAVNATVIGRIKTYQSPAYKDVATGQTIAVQPGGTLYGSFTSVVGATLIAYY